MKHTLPVLALATLAASASAYTAEPLSYNLVGLTYSTNSEGYGLQATTLVGNTNFLVAAKTSIGHNGSGNGADAAYLGYVFKNVGYSTDGIVTVGSNETYSLALRRSLVVELGSLALDLEGLVNYTRASGANLWGAELAYNLSKQYQFAVNYQHASSATSTTSLALRYKF
jgi:hypothetical protein